MTKTIATPKDWLPGMALLIETDKDLEHCAGWRITPELLLIGAQLEDSSARDLADAAAGDGARVFREQ